MKLKYSFPLRLLLLAGILIQFGCSTDFEVYAPAKEIRSVYAVLNPESDVQYVRIANIYQVEGDAIAYGGENDQSVKGLNVRLSGNNEVYQAVQIDSFPKDPDGTFYPYHTVYAITTDGTPGNPRIITGAQYHLEIGAPDDDDYLEAYSTTPTFPELRGALSIQSGAGNQKCLPKLELTNALNISWERGTASGFELKVIFRLERNGVSDSIIWGPTNTITDNRRCNDGSNRLCYQFNEQFLLDYFKARMAEDGTVYTYDTEDSCVVNPNNNPTIEARMPRSLEFEVTAADEFLIKYMTANNPQYLDLTGNKPEYSNIEGKIQAVGIFGSIAVARKYAMFRTCTGFKLGLNGLSQPPGCQ